MKVQKIFGKNVKFPRQGKCMQRTGCKKLCGMIEKLKKIIRLLNCGTGYKNDRRGQRWGGRR